MMAQTLKLYETAARSTAAQSSALLIKIWSDWVFLRLSISCVVAEGSLINTDNKDAMAELINKHTRLIWQIMRLFWITCEIIWNRVSRAILEITQQTQKQRNCMQSLRWKRTGDECGQELLFRRIPMGELCQVMVVVPNRECIRWAESTFRARHRKRGKIASVSNRFQLDTDEVQLFL